MKLHFDGDEAETNVLKKDLDPVWNEVVAMPVELLLEGETNYNEKMVPLLQEGRRRSDTPAASTASIGQIRTRDEVGPQSKISYTVPESFIEGQTQGQAGQ